LNIFLFYHDTEKNSLNVYSGLKSSYIYIIYIFILKKYFLNLCKKNNILIATDNRIRSNSRFSANVRYHFWRQWRRIFRSGRPTFLSIALAFKYDY